MAKQSGLDDRLFIGSVDLSGDTQALGAVGGGAALIEVTDITQSAIERIGGLRDGRFEWTSYFDPAVGASHPTLSALPTTDAQLTYLRGTTLGKPAASMIGKQVDYAGNRTASGEFTFEVNAQANRYGLEWGVNLTAGLRHDTGAADGTAVDGVASTDFGWTAWLHVTSFTGTDATVKIQDSANNIAFLDLAGAGFTQITAPTQQRLQSASATATVRQYVRVNVSTAAGFTHLYYVVNFCKHEGPVSF